MKRKNPIAKKLSDKRYKQTIIKSKKKYTRKGTKNEIKQKL